MKIQETSLPGVLLLTPTIYRDDRGAFWETWNQRFAGQAGLPNIWVQDNFSLSRKNVVRGLHYQITQPQGKLVRAAHGAVLDVAVDLRRSSGTFGQWFGIELQARNRNGDLEMLWIPEGFAHGFLVLSESAEVLYKVTRPYDPGGEQTLLWNDPAVAVEWPLHRIREAAPVLSSKDAEGLSLAEIKTF